MKLNLSNKLSGDIIYKKILSRQVFLFLADMVLVNLALLFALLLRFDGAIPAAHISRYLDTLMVFTFIRISIFYLTGLYKSLWQYASVRELLNIVVAVSLSSFSVYIISSLTGSIFPRGVYLISWIIQLAFIGGVRLGVRLLHTLFHKKLDGYLKKVLIIGAGEAGVMVANEMNKNRDRFCYKPIGYIDDDPTKKGKFLQGLKVFGTRDDMAAILKDKKVDEIIIAIPSAPKKEIRKVVEFCKKFPAKLKILPGVYELIEETVSLKSLRDVKIEDLLSRESVVLNISEIAAYLQAQTVLITGGGGSIGSELCRQVLHYSPKKLLIFGQGENSVFNIYHELIKKHPTAEIIPLIGSVQDSSRLTEVFSLHKPDVVFHAAAHKHVPLMEDNPREAIKNNIFGTRNVAEVAQRHKVKHFVMLSTDKAVNPVSVMGATKRVAEMVIQAMSAGSSTRFCAVRFGNVLGSRGSVIPLFREQIAAGGPVTVTHPDMVRYFMTIPEAVQLVIQAGAMGRQGNIFVLDMGEPVKIVDLATDLIRLSGLEPGKDIDIVYSGIRPGEKLYEEMLTKEEGVTSTRHDKIYIAKSNGIKEFKEELKTINKILQVDDKFLEGTFLYERQYKEAATN